MRRYFSAYGLRICADRPIPGLLPCRESSDVDVTVSLQFTPAALREGLNSGETIWQSSSETDSSHPVLQIKQIFDGAYLSFQYCDGTEFILDREGTRIWACWPEELDFGDVLPYLRGPVLGAVLRLRNVVSLHASAVSIGGHAIAFIGPPEAGKSTTAAAFARLGYAVLSDDVVALNPKKDGFWVQPGYPNVCLWPESVTALYGLENVLPRITPGWEKRYLDLQSNGYRFACEPLPLAAIYILDKRSSDLRSPFIEPVHGAPGLIELVANTYVSYLSDRSMRSRDFELLSRVAAHVPIRRVAPHSDPVHLQTMCDRILEDAETLAPSLAC